MKGDNMKDCKGMIEKLQATTKVDIDAIARGYYDLIPEDDKACMSMGMLPAQFMTMLEDGLRDKFECAVARIRAFYKNTFEGMDDYMKIAMDECDEYVKYNTSKVTKDISIKLIGIACEKGLCVV